MHQTKRGANCCPVRAWILLLLAIQLLTTDAACPSFADTDGQGFVNVDNPRRFTDKLGIPSATVAGKESYGLSVFHQLHCLASQTLPPLLLLVFFFSSSLCKATASFHTAGSDML
jgi:hypothetical protein